MARKRKRANDRALAKRQEAVVGQPPARSIPIQGSRFVVAGVLSAFVLLFCLLAVTSFQQKNATVDELVLATIKHVPDFADARVALVKSPVTLGKKDEAEEHYREGLRLLKARTRNPLP
jgi:hypothetical protein